MRFLRILLFLVLGVGVLVVALFAVARLGDGPIAIIPGGPLRSGPLVEEPVADWSFAAGVEEIELQLASQSVSRTTWIAVHEGVAYIPATLSFPPGKSWHLEAARHGDAVLRIEGRRYPVTLRRVEDEARASAVQQVLRGKYPPPPGSGGGLWLFEVRSRPG
jgi:hypothetical protein